MEATSLRVNAGFDCICREDVGGERIELRRGIPEVVCKSDCGKWMRIRVGCLVREDHGGLMGRQAGVLSRNSQRAPQPQIRAVRGMWAADDRIKAAEKMSALGEMHKLRTANSQAGVSESAEEGKLDGRLFWRSRRG